MKKVLLFSYLSTGCLLAAAQRDTVAYRPVINQFIRYYQAGLADSIYGLFSPAMVKAVGQERWKQMFPVIRNSSGAIDNFSFEGFQQRMASFAASTGHSANDLRLVLDSSFKIAGLFLKPKPAASNFTFSTAVGKLYGTLALPADTSRPFPVVLIIAGSGPTDRNGNSSLGINAGSYQMLADSLRKYGIASVRYDKRFIGQSRQLTQQPEAIRFEDFVADATGIIQHLKRDRRFSKVIVLGHSEGSLIGMMAATSAGAAGFISVAGAGHPAYTLLQQQLLANSKEVGTAAFPVLDSLRKGRTVPQVPAALHTIFNPALQPYLISWFRYNPQQEIKKLKAPVLLVQGTTDLQLGVQEAALLKKARPEARLQMVEGMNHVLKTAPQNRTQNLATYADPSLPLPAALIQTVVQFVHQISK